MKWGNMFLAGTGIALPAARIAVADEIAAGRYDAEQADRTGFVEFTSPDEGRSPLEYAADAANAALDATDLENRGEIGALFHTYVSPPGGPIVWNPTAKLHELMGFGRRVKPIGQSDGCTMALRAVEHAARWLNGAQPAMRGSAVVVGAEVWPRERVDNLNANGLILAGGSAAVVVSNIGGPLRILSTASETESTLADATRGKEPLTYDPQAAVYLGDRIEHFFANQIDSVTFREIRDDLTRSVALDALTDAGLSLTQIDFLIHTHSGASSLRGGYYRLFPNAREIVNTAEIGHHIGHVGTADWFIGLHILREQGKLKPGDRGLMIGGAGGWTEAAVVLEVLEP